MSGIQAPPIITIASKMGENYPSAIRSWIIKTRTRSRECPPDSHSVLRLKRTTLEVSCNDLLRDIDSWQHMFELLEVSAVKSERYRIEARSGLKGAYSHWVFESISLQGVPSRNTFVVWIGEEDFTADKLTRSCFVNIASFARKMGRASELILVLPTDHLCKGMKNQEV